VNGTYTHKDDCKSICGDGLKVHDENCDDGSDNTEGCKIGCKTGSLLTWICTGGD